MFNIMMHDLRQYYHRIDEISSILCGTILNRDIISDNTIYDNKLWMIRVKNDVYSIGRYHAHFHLRLTHLYYQ